MTTSNTNNNIELDYNNKVVMIITINLKI